MSAVAEANIVLRHQPTNLEINVMDAVDRWIDEASRYIALGRLDEAKECLLVAKSRNAVLKRP